MRGADRTGASVLLGSPPGNREPGPRAEPEPGREERPGSLTRILAVVGPTAIGKSALALELARSLDGEIVACDSMQVYRGFDAATAKPTLPERAAVPHHLVDVADPRKDFSLADYVALASVAIGEIATRGRVPIVVGGTGLYLRGLLRGVVPAPPRSEDLRARLRGMAGRHGSPRLHRWLRALDPVTASRIPPNDAQRIVRGLELALTGDTWSDRLAREGTWSGPGERYRALKIGLDGDREVLAGRIDERVDGFFAAGLVREVRERLADGVPPEANAFKAIGYREVLAAMREGSDPEGTRDAVKASTRRYAKRQRTWFRSETGVVWLDAGEGISALLDRTLDLWAGG
jgi:tRNA dimethylallyltransferase